MRIGFFHSTSFLWVPYRFYIFISCFFLFLNVYKTGEIWLRLVNCINEISWLWCSTILMQDITIGQYWVKSTGNLPILWMKRLRLSEFKQLAPKCVLGWQRVGNSNAGLSKVTCSPRLPTGRMSPIGNVVFKIVCWERLCPCFCASAFSAFSTPKGSR